MSALVVGIISAVCIFGGAMLGMLLRGWLPEHHLREDSKDTVKVGAGLIATMAALVLGLLVTSAKDSFDTMSTEITQGAAKIILLDRLLANYGPETKAVREQLRGALASAIAKIWPVEGGADGSEVLALDRGTSLEAVQKQMFELTAVSDTKRQLLGQAQQIASDLGQTRWLIIEQAQSSLPLPFFIILLFWLTMLHMSFGLLAPRNATVIMTLLICSISVSCALFLIVELSHPLHGLVKVSAAPMRSALEHLGR